ncbi:sulfite exporter TauE/SafE family protein [Desulfoplanes formicivorans]|uniref:Probable membrane transporter protein n=1 Tax=Desulfoplanes formicivorans TaxID=1592317 RepID=A0A194AG85_9BACT|nr:sulfite exporter TauE/SafE family protein [Desulfoplanes formicivorans]GAU08220.1 permease [Desulfoplanes formicivorans]
MYGFGITTHQFILAFCIAVFGAFGNGLAGFGLALLIGPFLLMINPAFFPGPIILLVGLITTMVMIRERKAVSCSCVKQALGGFIPGTALAALIAARLPEREIALLFGGLIFVAVGMSLVGPAIRPGKKILFSAGVLGGFMGTLSGVSMPPLALALQNRPGPELRGTIACVGFLSVILSTIALALVGRLGIKELQLALCLAPGVVLGYVFSFPVAEYFDKRCTRPAVFLLSSISAVAMIVRYV